MKKIILFILVAFYFNTAYSQDWEIVHHDADPMTKEESYDSYSFSDKAGNEFIIWSHRDKKFRLISHGYIFDYIGNTHIVPFTVGFYDNNGTFIEKIEIDGHVNESEPTMMENQFSSKKVKKIVSYIKEKKGSVRFLIPLYGRSSGMDFTVPCMKN